MNPIWGRNTTRLNLLDRKFSKKLLQNLHYFLFLSAITFIICVKNNYPNQSEKKL